MAFKADFYGYAGALDGWRRLQADLNSTASTAGPPSPSATAGRAVAATEVSVAEYLPWLNGPKSPPNGRFGRTKASRIDSMGADRVPKFHSSNLKFQRHYVN